MIHNRVFSSFIFTFISILISGCASQPLTIKEQFKPKTLSAEDMHKACLRGLSAACSLLNKGSEAQQKHPILQGASSESETTLVVQRKTEETLIYAIRKSDQKDLKDWSYPFFQTRFRSFSDTSEDHVHLISLKPNTTYEIIVFDESGMLKDQRFFKTINRNKKNAKIAIASCMNDRFSDVALKIWPELLAHEPDLIFLIGDNVYADNYTVNFGPANAEIIWNRYVQTRQLLPLFYAKNLIPVFAIWDDHDYGKNGGDRTFEHREASRQVFFDFFPHDYQLVDYDRGEGVSHSFFAYNLNWIFMDARFDRSPNGVKLADETHWGLENEKWLKQKLKSAQWPVFLIEGDQFFGGYHPFESFEGNHPDAFKRFLKELKSIHKPVMFISGDRHLTEIIIAPKDKLGYQTYELTSSGIHSTRYANAYEKTPNPHKLVGVPGEYNYMTMTIKGVSHQSINVQIESFGLDNKKFYSENLTVKK